MLRRSIYKKESRISRWGLFTRDVIKESEVVWKLDSTEKMLTEEEFFKLAPVEQSFAFRYKDWHILVTDGSIYVNHSCDPNLWWADDETLVASRDIQVGEEITYDYSTSDIGKWVSVWLCNCGAKNCRVKITGYDCLAKSFINRYQGHLPSWTTRFISENIVPTPSLECPNIIGDLPL